MAGSRPATWCSPACVPSRSGWPLVPDQDGPLSQEQVNALADGTRITVKWGSGGSTNEYVTERRNKRVGVVQGRSWFALVDCGPSRPQTVVELA